MWPAPTQTFTHVTPGEKVSTPTGDNAFAAPFVSVHSGARFDPNRIKVRSYPVAVARGEELQKGPYVAETFPVHIEDSYVIVET